MIFELKIKLANITITLIKACNLNPLLSTLTICLFYIMFDLVLASIEIIIFGERFVHVLDVVFQLMFIFYAAYSVYICAYFKDVSNHKDNQN